MTKKIIICISIVILVISGVMLFISMQQTNTVQDAAIRVLVYPEKYTPSMSSIQGIRLQVDYDSPVASAKPIC